MTTRKTNERDITNDATVLTMTKQNSVVARVVGSTPPALRAAFLTGFAVSATFTYHAIFTAMYAAYLGAYSEATDAYATVHDAFREVEISEPIEFIEQFPDDSEPSKVWTRKELTRLIVKTADMHRIDPAWFLAIVNAENRKFDIEAINCNKNRTCDIGLAQVNDSNIKRNGYTRTEMFNPQQNLELAALIIVDAITTAERLQNSGNRPPLCAVANESPRWLKIAEYAARTYNGGAKFRNQSPKWHRHTCQYAARVINSYLNLNKPSLMRD